MAEDPNKITYFAKTNSRGKEVPFGIKRRDRARHMYVIGKTGMGKSTLLENLAIQDIRNGEGLAFIDPHGSTAEKLLEYVPEDRIKDVIYFAPFDMEHPIAFNVMEDVGYDKRHLVVSGLITAFKKLWVDMFSARMEYILSNVLLALLEYPGSTMLDVNRMLVNKAFRKKVVDNVSDTTVKAFWVEEFANYTDRYTQDATPAIQNKVGQFTSNPLIRNIIGQPKSSFDFRKAMDEKKILIINLSKGRVGEVNAALLGSMLVTKIYLAAMSRADSSAAEINALPNFYFYVDEFQSFANESFADILSEARKYKLNLVIAHQYVEQMEEKVRNAVFGNVGTTVAFRVGPFDAEVLETIFQPQFLAADLVNLGFAQVYLTLMIDGAGSQPFSATTLPPFDVPPATFVDAVIASSRTQFAEPRAEVEAAIAKWQADEADTSKDEKAARAKRAPEGSSGSPRPVSRAVPASSTYQSSSPSAPKSNPTPASSTYQSPSSATPVSRPAEPKPSAAPLESSEPPVPAVPPAAIAVEPTPAKPAPIPAPVAAPVPAVKTEPLPARSVGVQTTTSASLPLAPGRQTPHSARERTPHQSNDRPALEGSLSLREALAKATGRESLPRPPAAIPTPPTMPPVRHVLDLKETLKHIAPQSVVPAPANPSSSTSTPLPHSDEPNEGGGSVPERSAERKPAGIAEHDLRRMLEVEDFNGNQTT